MAFVKKVQLGNNVYGLKYSAYTYIVYKNFFGTDFMQDLQEYTTKNKNLKEIVAKIEKDGIEKASADEINLVFGSTVNSEVLVRFGIACIAAYRYPKQSTPEDILDELDPEIFYDGEFISATTDLMLAAVGSLKKKIKPFN